MSVGERSPEARAFERFLRRQSDFAFVGSGDDVESIATAPSQCVPHVLLIYLKGAQNAKNMMRHVLSEAPDVRMLVVAPRCTRPQAIDTIESGAWGILTYGDLRRHGSHAIRVIRDGEMWASRKVLSHIVDSTARRTWRQITQSKAMLALTSRQGEIVKLLQDGSTNKEIAAQLSISDKTVKVHLRSIFGKLKINRRNKILPKLFD
jgi:DNA-binding NarL/FixJ family response regulator